MLSKLARIAAAELVFYGPFFLATVFIAKIQRFDRRTAWIYLIFLAVIRIIGASLQLRLEFSPTKALITTAAIANSVGIAPLLLFMNWQLRRINRETFDRNVAGNIFYILYALVGIAVILAIVGGALATYSTVDPFHAEKEQKIAVIILIVTFAAMVILNIFMLTKNRFCIKKNEKVTFTTITLAIPFVTSRLTYACVSAFYVSKTFSPVVGNAFILAFMSVFEEFMAAILYFLACLWTPRLQTKSGETPENTVESSTAEESSKLPDHPIHHEERAQSLRSEKPESHSTAFGADRSVTENELEETINTGKEMNSETSSSLNDTHKPRTRSPSLKSQHVGGVTEGSQTPRDQ